MTDLLDLLLEAGLLQFGWFPRNGTVEPVQFHLDLLASYPDVLKQLAHDLAAKLPPAERLLCAVESLPLGTALALETGIPLVYSRGNSREPVHNLVGAYDIGHPTVFLSNVVGREDIAPLLARARRVGLSVTSGAAIIAVGKPTTLPAASLLTMDVIVESLVTRGVLPIGQATMVRTWLSEQG